MMRPTLLVVVNLVIMGPLLCQGWNINLTSGAALDNCVIETTKDDTLLVHISDAVGTIIQPAKIQIEQVIGITKLEKKPTIRRFQTVSVGWLLGLGGGMGAIIVYGISTHKGIAGETVLAGMFVSSFAGAALAEMQYKAYYTIEHDLSGMSTEEKIIFFHWLLEKRNDSSHSRID